MMTRNRFFCVGSTRVLSHVLHIFGQMSSAVVTPFFRYFEMSFSKLRPYFGYSAPRHVRIFSSAAVASVSDNPTEYRQKIAPWLKFGSYEKGLLSHLSRWELLRALCVLQLCSWDFIVDRSVELFKLSQRFGRPSQWLVRKTFFDQFVGGEDVPRMTQVVDLLHERGLTLMVAPVLEEDVEEQKSSGYHYDDNCASLKSIAKMTASLDKQQPIVQLKPSAIMPAKTLEQVNLALETEWQDASRLAKVVEQVCRYLEGGAPPAFLAPLAPEDKTHFTEGLRRAHELVGLGEQLGIKILVDAEFYSCKLAISTLALALMLRFNAGGYVVGDTIQGYLKEALWTVDMELQVMLLLGSHWYGKIVRGAYMDRERLIAKGKGVSSPICENYWETSVSYDKCVDRVLRHLHGAPRKGGHLLIATHNEKSIRLAAQTLRDLGLPERNEIASFGNIYGMADYLSVPLVNAGYKVYKSTPYGPLTRVVPYLGRRASENRSVVQGAREERLMLRRELFSRLKF